MSLFITVTECTMCQIRTMRPYTSESQYWKRAVSEEMKSLLSIDTFEICRLPEGRKVIGGRWVYAVKLGPNGDEQYKSSIQDIDYSETFSPTVRITSVRMLMQLAVQQGMIVHQMDVKTAYLNAPVDCELYIEQPEGFVADDKTDSNLVLKLKKSLYGLKQSGRNWNNILHDYLISEGFEQSSTDHWVYTRFNMDSKVILFWVDDIIIAASNESVLKTVKQSMHSKFKMKDLGQLSWFLRINFTYSSESETIEMN